MNQFCLFSSGQELANLVVSSDLLHSSWNVVSDLRREAIGSSPTLLPVIHKIYERPPGCITIAFASSRALSASQLQEGNDLVPSENLKGLDFISTKVNPSVSINRAAAALFASFQDKIPLLKDQVSKYKSVIVIGHSLGGSIASLFTLCLLNDLLPKDVGRPLCITFGSPLLGNDAFQRAIVERPKWHSCFLHLVYDKIPIPKLFTYHPDGSVSLAVGSHKPFGTFLFCSKSGYACFEEPQAILELLTAATSLESARNQTLDDGSQITHYTMILGHLKNEALCRGTSYVGAESVANPFQAGIIVQLAACGVVKSDQQNWEDNGTVKRLRFFQIKSKNVFDPSRKLNDRKIDMTYLEWYKKVTGDQDGYYDSYKKARFKSKDEIRSKEEIVKRQRILTQYWKHIVEEVEKMPQKEGSAFRVRWLYGGTNYRRMIEPLDIADYYMKGKRSYITQGRSKHYKLLEQWMNEDRLTAQQHNENERVKACSLTEDSCFWAHVEEAIISCGVLKEEDSDEESKKLSKDSLLQFEKYVMDLIKKKAVSPEVFLTQSSFMEWWEKYLEQIVGVGGSLELTDFMINNGYKSYI